MAWVDSTEPGIHYTLRGLNNEILREVHELSGVWSWRKDYIFAGATHIATVDSSGTKHVHKDHLGSTRVITNASGAKLSEHRYWPFGEEMTATSSPERMRFAGHERDSQTSLDYMHARYYAPFGGRFLSVDPGRDFDPAHPQSWNLYAYVRNNPVSAVDPDGRMAWWAPAAIGGAVGAGFHLARELGSGKPLGEALKGIHRPMIVGVLGGLGKRGALWASLGQFAFSFKDARDKGASIKAAAVEASDRALIVLGFSGAAGKGVETAVSAQYGQGASAATAGIVTGSSLETIVSGVKEVFDDLGPTLEQSSGQLKSKVE
ncbi:hypothetical protein EG19_01125 [Thermoanaerobaculum aquaticum]|uniref:RHS repeat-associated core domain-containing protein n=1 Tax=Thermoanaerobaculum aquaticum TaxID=1312852 RepID=A0A062XTL5_9BACT|nr:hypothetical protein EG19_01125 [Thermoanaerobaculum aquaticum]